jgi:ABC-type transport system involved in multi-copper enzyme maturation, permease component
MNAALTIAKREIRTYFNSPIAYIVLTVFLLLAGYLFFGSLFIERQAELRSYFNLMPLLFAFIVPAIAMRLIAEEKGSGSLEMLITMPVPDWQVIVGKFLAGMALLTVLVGLTLCYAITVMYVGPLDKGPAIGGYLGLLLMGGAYMAIGVMASTFTRNQIVAFIISFAICFALYLFYRLLPFVPESLRPVLSYLSVESHFEAISRGVIDSRDIIYYLSVMVVSLVIATVSLESRKWK